MKDPRSAINRQTYLRMMSVLMVLLAAWIVIGIWFDPPKILDKIVATACVLVGIAFVTWPIGKDRA